MKWTGLASACAGAFGTAGGLIPVSTCLESKGAEIFLLPGNPRRKWFGLVFWIGGLDWWFGLVVGGWIGGLDWWFGFTWFD